MANDLEIGKSVVITKSMVIEKLKDSYANGYLLIDDFEDRISSAENTSDIELLKGLISDIPNVEVMEITESESINIKTMTKKIEGSILQTRKIDIEASMSTVYINYQKQKPIDGKQELCLNLNMSNLIIYLPDDVIIDNRVNENMSTFHENRNINSNLVKPRTIIKLTGKTNMSNIKIKRKKYYFRFRRNKNE